MSDLESNKRTVVEYLELAFNEGRPEEAVERYQGPTYTQHNPMAGDGAGPFIGFAKGFKAEFPESRIDIKRVIGEGDLVVVHLHARNTPDDRGAAAIDIFASRTASSSSTGTSPSRFRRHRLTRIRCSEKPGLRSAGDSEGSVTTTPKISNEEQWRGMLTGEVRGLHRIRRVMGWIPSEPRCKLCDAPFGRPGSLALRFLGFGPSALNRRPCRGCIRYTRPRGSDAPSAGA